MLIRNSSQTVTETGLKERGLALVIGLNQAIITLEESLSEGPSAWGWPLGRSMSDCFNWKDPVQNGKHRSLDRSPELFHYSMEIKLSTSKQASEHTHIPGCGCDVTSL